LAFGSLLLLGGKLGDLFGRKWTLIAGLAGFSIASAIGGLSQSFGMLVAARALQGAFGALLAPSALGLLTVTFMDSPDRPKAFAIFSGLAAAGGSFGLLLGGALTQAISWRWCMYVNLVIAIPTALVALRLLGNVRNPNRPRIDFPGLIAGSGGLFALVYGFSNAETHSWTATVTIVALAASVVLLVAFVLIEFRAKHPLLPLSVIADRARGGAYASMLVASAGMFSILLFLTFYLQSVLGYSPLKTGVAMLPMTASILVTAQISLRRLVPRFGAKPLVMGGSALAAVAMYLFTRLTPDSSYAAHVLPGLVLVAIGLGAIVSSSIGTATLGVDPRQAGVASAMVNTSQQVGGSIGTALLSTLFASAVHSYVSAHPHAQRLAAAAAVHGYTTAFWWAAGIFGLGLLVALLILPTPGREVLSSSSGVLGVGARRESCFGCRGSPSDCARRREYQQGDE
jgi:EmrB/QacA subfamily drug resistance transporter